eukprot:GHVS01019248.1.p1 GENE.GHVS01019248.1~~GHVS01019248.1.p1  ORF type:complete len:951 (-),score=371.40 GHVS01019248.1:224-3076(-)
MKTSSSSLLPLLLHLLSVWLSYHFPPSFSFAVCNAQAPPPPTAPSVSSCQSTEVLFVSQFPADVLSLLGLSPSSTPDILLSSYSMPESSVPLKRHNASTAADAEQLNLPDYWEEGEEGQQGKEGGGGVTSHPSPSHHSRTAPTVMTIRAVVLEGKTMPLWQSHDVALSPPSFDDQATPINIPQQQDYILQQQQQDNILQQHDINNSPQKESEEHASYRPQQQQLLRYFQKHPPPPSYRLSAGGFFVFHPPATPASIFKVLAPVTGVKDMFATMLMLPVIKVAVQTGQGLFVSYKVSATEGQKYKHKHEDERHRVIADVDVQYRRCELKEEEQKRDIPVTISLTVSHCPQMSFTWLVRCTRTEYLQDVARGFHAGRVYTPSRPGDVVADGVTSPTWADVNHAMTLVSKQDGVTDIYVWCAGCSELTLMGGLETKFPSIASDMDVVSAEVHLRKPRGPSDDSAGFYFGSGDMEGDKFLKLRDSELWHFQITYDCHKEGRSVVVVEFPFHSYRNVQFAFQKDCPSPSDLYDHSCSSAGLLSADKSVCCPKSCGTCCGDLCSMRNGGPDSCCCVSIIRSQRTCHDSSPPCVVQGWSGGGDTAYPDTSASISSILSRTHRASDLQQTDADYTPAAGATSAASGSGGSGSGGSGSIVSGSSGGSGSSAASGSGGGGSGSSGGSSGISGGGSSGSIGGSKSSGSSGGGVGVFSRFVRWVLRTILLWCLAGCVILVVLSICDKFTRGHRGRDLIPAVPELFTSFQTAIIRFRRLLSTVRNTKYSFPSSFNPSSSSSSATPAYPPPPPHPRGLGRFFANFSSSSSAGAYESVRHPSINLSTFDADDFDDSLTGTSLPALVMMDARGGGGGRTNNPRATTAAAAGVAGGREWLGKPPASGGGGGGGGGSNVGHTTTTTTLPVVIGGSMGGSKAENGGDVSGGSDSVGQQQVPAEFPYGSI